MWNFREIWHEMAVNPEFVSLPQCGHLPHEEQPERVNEELFRFLEPWRTV
jgi:haloacetate dehalogenase